MDERREVWVGNEESLVGIKRKRPGLVFKRTRDYLSRHSRPHIIDKFKGEMAGRLR